MATINAASASYADVNTAITSASNGDTVNVPAGAETWASTLTINKGIDLIAAGCTITNGMAGGEVLIAYYPSDYSLNQSFRLSSWNFDANSQRVLQIGSNQGAPFTINNKVHIDHNNFTNSGGYDGSLKGQFIYNIGSLYGVADNNTFEESGYPIAHTGGQGGSGTLWWDYSPQNTFEYGSQYYFYYEDNTFDLVGYQGATADNILTDGEYAARYCFRYNTINNTVPSYSLFDMHGNQGDGPSGMDSCFGAEIYGNYISHGSNYMACIKQRSGQSLIFWNTAITTSSADNIAYTGGADTCPSSNCSDKVTHNCYWFGNRHNTTGSYWGASASADFNCCSQADRPKLGREVFNESSSPAVTQGTFANRPASPSVGQGYWATDQDTSDLTNFVGANPTTPISGTLYICESEGEWTEFYTPYTYPHPLRTQAALGAKVVMVLT